MTDSPQNSSTPHPPDGHFDSLDCVIVIDDGPADLTPRPLTGKAREAALRERDLLVRYGLLPPLPEQEKNAEKLDGNPPAS